MVSSQARLKRLCAAGRDPARTRECQVSSEKKKKKKMSPKTASQPSSTSLPDQLNTGMPAQDNIRKVVDFVSPQGNKYQILKTTESDAYDQIPEPKKKRRKS